MDHSHSSIPPHTDQGCLSHFQTNTTAEDGWHPRQYKDLSEDCLQALGSLMALYQRSGNWGHEGEQDLLVRCLPKEGVDDARPSLLFRSSFRLWGKLVQYQLRGWQAEQLADPELNNMRGKRCGDSLWRAIMKAGIARHHQMEVAEIIMDVSKTFDRVRGQVLIARALQLGYPPQILRMSMRSCRWPRRLVLGPLIGREVHPEVGIAPGSPVATLELAMVLAVDIRRLRHAYPAASFLVHVDDVSFQLQHKDPVALAKEMVCIAADVVHNIEREVGLRFSLQK